MTYRQKQVMHRKVDAIAMKWEPKFARAAATALRRDKRELVKRMQPKAEVEWTVIQRKWDEYFERFADEAWRKEFMPLIEGLVAEQGESWNTTLGMQFDVRNYLAEAWLEDYMLVFAQDINNTTKQDTSSILLDAMQQGWGIDRMNNGLGLLFDKYINDKKVDCSRDDLSPEEQWFCDRQPKYRRDMISRTETIRASAAGSVALFGAYKIEKKEWWATGDDRTRDSHLIAWQNYSEGGTPGPILMDQPFQVGGARLMQPGDPSGPPEETVNCRCTPLPFMDSWAGTEEEIAAARADMDAEVTRREAEAVVPEPEVEERKPGKVGGVAPVGPDTTTERMDEWQRAGLDMDVLYPLNSATQSQRAQAKKEIVDALHEKIFAEGYVISKQDINKFIHQWAESSNDDDMRSLAIQKAASELFGIPLSKFTQGKINERITARQNSIDYYASLEQYTLEEAIARVDKLQPQSLPLLLDDQQKAILQAMYDNTQERLALAGFNPGDTVRLRRGVKLPEDVARNWRTDDIVPIEGNSLESWATSEYVAKNFSFPGADQIGIVFEMDIPIEAIVGSDRTGFGCLTESEFVVMGWPGEAKILSGKGAEWVYPEG